MNSFIEHATLLKMKFFLGIFQEFFLKVPKGFFYYGTFILLQNMSLHICSNSKYVVHGLFKIIPETSCKAMLQTTVASDYVSNKSNKSECTAIRLLLAVLSIYVSPKLKAFLNPEIKAKKEVH